MNHDPSPYSWLQGFQTWGIVVGAIFGSALLLSVLFSFLTSSISAAENAGKKSGFWKNLLVVMLSPSRLFRSLFYDAWFLPTGGGYMFLSGLWGGIQDLIFMSPKRIWAIAILVFREAVRRKTPYVLVVFGICFLFAGWFLSNPAQTDLLRIPIYVSFVLTAISWLILPAVFLLACWGLPDDIKARSLHTIVTKPARRSEILTGRILGVTLIGTAIVVCMSVVGYIWLTRAIPSVSTMTTRVPILGNIKFKDRQGKDAEKGVNVGDINQFRSFIEGNTGACAYWHYEGVAPRVLDRDGKLVVEGKFQAFRTHKGDMRSNVRYQLALVNPETKQRVFDRQRHVQEFRDTIVHLETSLLDEENKPVDLMKDIVHDGKLIIEVYCRSGGQFLGMARPDLFIRAADTSFAASFFKAVFTIWLMMVLIIVFAVTVSTAVKGPVAAFLTGVIIVLGVFGRKFMLDLVSVDDAGEQKWKGGGMFESVYRIITHMNPTIDLDPGFWRDLVKAVDYPFTLFATRSRSVIPDFQCFQMSEYVAKGYDVPWDSGILPALMHTLSFLVPCIVLGCFILRSRELESK
jgi:ABC-type transport system involved in multi-copper enzyme maturation permease subunit